MNYVSIKTKVLISVLSLVALSISAQKGGISNEMLRQISRIETPSVATRALTNAIASNSIKDLAKNAANSGMLDSHFSIETPKQSIHDQKSSGRCWMFSGLNVLRSDFAHNHGDSLRVEFSHAYLFFYDQLEKSNLMLQGIIDCAQKPIDDVRVQFFFKNPISDGGTFCGVADLAEKYGLVPMSVQPETYSSDNTGVMDKLISSKLREFGLELRKMVVAGKSKSAVLDRKTEMLSTIYHMLTLSYGTPVKEFTYTFTDEDGKPVGESRKYTPKSFYEATVGAPLNGTFIMVMNDPRRPYYKTYEVQYDRHMYDGHNWVYLNLPINEISKLAIASLKDGKKLYSSYDVAKQLDSKRGYMDTENYDYGSLMGTTFSMDKADRINTFDSGSTHAMTLTAVDIDTTGNPLKWKVENSWGADYGAKGCLIMSNRWFGEYMFRMVVNKKYASEEILKAAGQKPVMVMPEDPLFSEDD